jgi:peptide/nickel transport system substrate-binding protein
MTGCIRAVVAAGVLTAVLSSAPGLAQKPGGVLKISHFDSPASISMLEEATGTANRPMMAVFNNLVMHKQDVAQASLQSIIPDLATVWS